MITRAAQLRLLIANSRQRQLEIEAALESMLESETTLSCGLLPVGIRAKAELEKYEAELAQLSLAAHASTQNATSPLVTSGELQPGIRSS